MVPIWKWFSVIDWLNQSTAEKNWELQSEVCNVSWNLSIDLKSLSFVVKTEIKYKVWLSIGYKKDSAQTVCIGGS